MKKFPIIILISLIFLLFILFIVYISYKKFDVNSKICEIDEDCIIVTSLNKPCDNKDAINKNYQKSYKYYDYLDMLFKNHHYKHIMCDQPTPFHYLKVNKPYCNNQKICSQKIDCEKTCENWHQNSETFNFEEITFELKREGCNCDAT